MFKSYQKSHQLKTASTKKEPTFGKKKYYLNSKPKKPLKKSFIKKKPTKIKRHDIVDIDFMIFVSTFPCIVTGARTVHVHHIYGRNGKVLGEGRNDFKTVPLAPTVHSIGEKSYHSISEDNFIEYYNLEEKIKHHGSLKNWFLFESKKIKDKYENRT